MTSAGQPDAAFQKARDLYHQGRREQAQSHLRRFLQRSSRHPAANNLMAIMLLAQGRLERALLHARIAATEDPGQVVFHNTLGVVLSHLKRDEEAVEVLRSATQLHAPYAPAHLALGIALSNLGRTDEAETCFRAAMQLQPQIPRPRTNLAKLLLDTGRAAECVSELEAALQLAPDDRQALSDLAGALNYIEVDPAHVFEVHKRLGMLLQNAVSQQKTPLHPAPGRFRIGYISADFRAHSVSFFVEPLLRAHDTRRVETFCYHTSPEHDDVTRRIKALAHKWRDVSGLSDQALVDRIRQDRLNVLIDLGGHTSGNRLAALAARPAPVQANWCGYANTTGLPAIDFRIVDHLTDPPGAEALATERLLRLPRCFLCYGPPPNAPEPGPPPSLAAGHITFGSFNMLPKIGPAAVAHWAAVMKAVPDSRMLIKAKGVALPGVRDRIVNMFAADGIAAERIETIDYVPTLAEHLSRYNRVDIAMDTWPYHGTTTTCEALWMGVPVVTRVGNVHAARVGLSLLTAAGLPELAATDFDGFVRTAADLATDIQRRTDLRTTLRATMAASPLCDATDFARSFEDILL